MSRVVGKVRLLTWTLILTLGVFMSLLAGLLFTGSGLTLLVWGAEKAVPTLQIDKQQGSLWSGFTLQHIRYQTPAEQPDITLQQAELELDFRCLAEPKICVRNLALQGLKLVLTPVEGAEKSEDIASERVVLPGITLPLPVDITQLELRDFTLKQSGQAPVTVNHIRMSAYAQGADVTLRQLALDMPLLEAKLSGQIALASDYPLTLEATGKLRQTALAGEALSLSADGSMDTLRFTSRLSGPVSAQLHGQLQPLGANLPFTLQIAEGRSGWPLQGKADYQAEVSELRAEGSLDGYTLSALAELSGKDIPGTQVSLSGSGDLQQIALSDIRLETLGGEVSGQAEAGWSGPVNWQGQLAMQDIQPGRQWPQAQGRVSGTLSVSGSLSPSGSWRAEVPELDIQGMIREYPLTAQGSISAEDKSGEGDIHLATTGLTLRHGRNGIRLSGSVNDALDLQARVDIPALQRSLPDGRGRISGQMALRGSRDKPALQASLRAGGLGYQQLNIGTLSLNADLFAQPDMQGRLELQAEDARYAEQQIDSLTLALTGRQTAHRLSLGLRSERGELHMQLSGALPESGDGLSADSLNWQGALDSVSVSTRQGTWVLSQPARLAYRRDTQQVSVQAHCWEQEKARLCLTEDMQAGRSGKAALALQSFNFRQIATLLPEDIGLSGRADLTGSVNWQPGRAPEGRVTVRLPPGKVVMNSKQGVELGWERAQLHAALNADGLQSDWQVDLSDNGDIRGTLAVTDLRKPDKQLSGQLTLDEIDLSLLDAWLGDYSHLGANLNSDISFRGPLMHPMLHGDLRIDQILAQGDFTPVEVHDGQVALTFSGYQAVLAAELESADGRVSVNGEGQWRDRQAWSSRMTVRSDELLVSLPPDAEIKVRPDLQIQAAPGEAKISGDIYLPWARVEVEELPPSAVSVSSDEVLLDSHLQPIERKKAMPLNVETDVNVHIGDDFRLAAFGLLGNLSGLLTISQKDQVPFVVGDVEIRDGTYQSFGQDLVINEGTILMNGPVDQPYVAIEAVRNPESIQDDVTAGIKVTGPARQPEIEVFSDPEMPQANALSYLLRGRDLDAESEDSSMTMTLIGLSLAQSGKLVGEIGEAFGVSDLQLDTAGSGEDSQVTVSGYILPGLQVKYGVGIFNSLGEVTIRYRLMQDLYLEAVSGLTSTVDLLYQFEFD